MEGRSESDRGGDEVCSATFGDEEKTELKLDDDDDDEVSVEAKLVNIQKHNVENSQW